MRGRDTSACYWVCGAPRIFSGCDLDARTRGRGTTRAPRASLADEFCLFFSTLGFPFSQAAAAHEAESGLTDTLALATPALSMTSPGPPRGDALHHHHPSSLIGPARGGRGAARILVRVLGYYNAPRVHPWHCLCRPAPAPVAMVTYTCNTQHIQWGYSGTCQVGRNTMQGY